MFSRTVRFGALRFDDAPVVGGPCRVETPASPLANSVLRFATYDDPRTTAPRRIGHWTMLETTLHPDRQRLATAISAALDSVQAAQPGPDLRSRPRERSRPSARPVVERPNADSGDDPGRCLAGVGADRRIASGGARPDASFELVLTPYGWMSALPGTTTAAALDAPDRRRCARRNPRRADRLGHSAPSVRRFDCAAARPRPVDRAARHPDRSDLADRRAPGRLLPHTRSG